MKVNLTTGNFARGALPTNQDGAKAQDLFDLFTADSVELISRAFEYGDAIEGEIYAKVAFGIVSQRVADLFNPDVQARADAKRLKVMAVAAIAMAGRPVFKNLTETAAQWSAADTDEWIVRQTSLGFKFLNRIENRWRMGVKVANLALKQRQAVVACFQAKSKHAALVAFIELTRPMVASVMNELVAAKAAAKKNPDLVASVKKYLDGKPFGSSDIAALISHLNTLHAHTVALETTAAKLALGEVDDVDDDEVELSQAA